MCLIQFLMKYLPPKPAKRGWAKLLRRTVDSIRKYGVKVIGSGKILKESSYEFFSTLIFYYDCTKGPEVEMPDAFELFKTKQDKYASTYKLISVIVADGARDDVLKMKVLHRPRENVEEFVKVANEKGLYFLYETINEYNKSY
ncbi:hypothetical protein ENBRE01_0857 [Enteropsectra breve]|nr:hypothetical protein ENBRE01_0857 [Enteropsectra breve]